MHSAQCVLASFTRSETVALGGKVAFKDRFNDLEQRPLHDSISRSRDSSGTLFLTPSLGYPDPLDGLRLVLIGSQFLFQLRYCLVFVYFNLSRALLIDSRASAFGYYLLQRSIKVLWTPDFINQPKPLSSFNPRFQRCQHAFRPDDLFHPCPSGTDLSILWRPLGHCRRCLFRSSVFHASTFLPPFAPRALPRFFALTKALSPFGHGSSDRSSVMNAIPFPNSDP